jgi:pimeloyl-ACP methyl ester carboxylesterase
MLEQQGDSPEPQRRPAPYRGGFRLIGRLMVTAIGLYVGILAVLSALQVRLIFPGADTQGKPSSVVHAPPGAELVSLKTEHDDKIVSLFGPALLPNGHPHPDPGPRPTILYFYGNAMCLNDTMFEFEHFRRMGLNVMIPEFVGYGMSGGKPSETGCRDTADAAFAHLQGRKDINPRKIVAAGWSLGGAVAIDLAARKPVAGLITFCTFTSIAEMSRRSFPFLPATLLLRHRFDSESKMSHITCPILLGHGRRDEIVPVTMLDRLAATATKAPVMKFIVDDAGHNDFYSVGKDQIFQAMDRFLAQFTPDS